MSTSQHSRQLPDQVTVIFDGTCNFCTRSARFARWLDRNHRVTTLPFQQHGVPEEHGLTVAECQEAGWAAAPGWEPQRGAGAAMFTLSVALGNRVPWLIYRLPVIRQVFDVGYKLVDKLRPYLPGDKPYCDQFPDECGATSVPEME